MMDAHWLRLYHGTTTDPKWQVVARRACHTMSRQVTRANIVAVWTAMLEAASQSNPRGSLQSWSDEDVGASLDIDESEIRAIREAMIGKTLHEDGKSLIGWEKRQPKRERQDDTAADRKRAQRERDMASSGVTVRDKPMSHHVTPRGEERREEKKEQEQEHAPQASASVPSKRGSRLPDDWRPDETELAWAASACPGIDARREAEKFRDYWRAKAGKDGVKLDWSATFRNWLRNAKPASTITPFRQQFEPISQARRPLS